MLCLYGRRLQTSFVEIRPPKHCHGPHSVLLILVQMNALSQRCAGRTPEREPSVCHPCFHASSLACSATGAGRNPEFGQLKPLGGGAGAGRHGLATAGALLGANHSSAAGVRICNPLPRGSPPPRVPGVDAVTSMQRDAVAPAAGARSVICWPSCLSQFCANTRSTLHHVWTLLTHHYHAG